MTKDNNEFLLVIDGSSLLSTQFFGNMPRELLFEKDPEKKKKYYNKIMQTTKGVYTNAVFGFLRTLFSIVENQKPTYLAVTWDLTRDTFRRELYADYKANRTETMEPLKDQFKLMQDVLKRIGVKEYMSMEFEADDFSGSLSTKFSKDVPVAIMTKDRDYLQLVNEKVSLWLIANDQKKANEYFAKYDFKKDSLNIPDKTIYMDLDHVSKEYGVEPGSIASLKGLQGDSSDNIKGVPGIGEKTAVALIAHYKSVDALYEAVNAATDPKALAAEWKENLGISRNPIGFLTKESDEEIVGEKAARLSEKLATIKCDIPIEESLEDLKTNLNPVEIMKVFSELEINTLKMPASISGEESTDTFFADYKEGLTKVTDFEIMMSVKDEIIKDAKGAPVGIAIKKENKDVVEAGICLGTKSYLIAAEGFIYPQLITDLVTEVVRNASYVCSNDYKLVLGLFDEDVNKDYFDMGIVHYLINPLTTKHDAVEVCKLTDNELATDTVDLSFEAFTALNKKDDLNKILKDKALDKLYNDIEKPLVKVLSCMEKAGVICSGEELDRQGQVLSEALTELEKDIYELAGEHFNILSPKQLGVILFEKLGLKAGKKTKSGYSTSAEVLEKLAPDNEIVQKVLDYRTLSKLISTYILGLKGCIREDGRIHPTFNQTITATGRLSCTEPNLQNIPVREELGRKIRKAFVPADGCVFVDADYSQIELRIMAHMSQDARLIDDYKNARDIHRATAANVFHVPYDEVTKKQRSNAKAVNFGIIYGISSFGLGQDLDISRAEAKDYINTYFKEYPGVKKYLDDCVQKAKDNLYAESIYGRKRPMPELDSTNFMTRSFGERVAMNMPIQGTAADIMKIAMIRVHNALREAGLKSKMLLQIHDEILIEAPVSEQEEVKAILEREMINAASLKVKLEVDANIANNWYDLK